MLFTVGLQSILHKCIPSFPSETQLGYCFMNMTHWILTMSKSFVLLIREIKQLHTKLFFILSFNESVRK